MFPSRIRAELRAGGCTEEEVALFLRIDGAARRRARSRAARRALRGVRVVLARTMGAVVPETTGRGP